MLSIFIYFLLIPHLYCAHTPSLEGKKAFGHIVIDTNLPGTLQPYQCVLTLPMYAYLTNVCLPYQCMRTLPMCAYLTNVCLPYQCVLTLPMYAYLTIVCLPYQCMLTLPMYAYLTNVCLPPLMCSNPPCTLIFPLGILTPTHPPYIL